MPPRGRPKHVDRGTFRRAFTWRGPAGVGESTQYCTVSWMRHGERVAAVATYRSLAGADITFIGMAHGDVDGPLQAAGDPARHSVRDLLGRAPVRERDGIEACAVLAVQSLEAAAHLAVATSPDEDQPWQARGRAECQAHRFAQQQARKAARS